MGISQTGTDPSESVGNYTELREAANSLSRYVSFATKDKLTAVSSIVKSNLQSADAKTNDPISIEFAQKLELVVGSSEGSPLFDAAAALLGKTAAIRYDKFTPGTGGMLNGPASGAGGWISTPIKGVAAPRVVSVFNHAAAERVNISSSLSDIAAIFCALTPAVEMSLCVPYFDVRIIYPREANGQGALSLTRYVGVKPVTITPNQAKTTKILNEDLARGYSVFSTTKIGYDVAGMEIFTVPQTLGPKTSFINSVDEIRLRGVTVLDPLSPLMTLESANIQQTGIGGSLYAQTKIELKLTLHDRSRLGDIEPLVTAQAFPSVNFRITYGWKHPDDNKMSSNVYAKLLNAMRVTQDFVVSSVSISSKDAGLSISVSLVSAGSFVAKSAKILTGEGQLVPYSVLQPLIKQIVNFRSDKSAAEPFKSVGTTIVTNTNPAASAKKFIKVDNFYKFKEIIDAQLSVVGEKDKAKINAIVKALTDLETTGVVEPDVAQYSDLFKFPSNGRYGDFVPIGIAPSLNYSDRMNKLLSETKDDKTKTAGIIPMSAAVSKYVALPLLLSQPDIDEVRIHFYSFNSTAGYQAAQCIGDFPIILKDIISTRNSEGALISYVDGRTSTEKILNMLTGQASKPDSPFFGLTTAIQKQLKAAETGSAALSSASTTQEVESAQQAAKKKQDELRSQTDSANLAILSELGIQDLSDTAYVPPRVKSHMEVVPAYLNDDEKSTAPRRLLRIHIYDERASGIGNKANFLVSLMNSSSGVGIVGAGVSISSDIESLLENLTDTSDTDRKYYSLRDKSTARQFIANAFPTLTIGSDTGMITNATFSSQPAGDVASGYLLTALEGGSTGNATGASATGDLIDDVNIIPTTINMTMIGNVLLTRGQTYFIDFNTGTTLDNTYTVTSVSHSIKPGSFTTSATFAPVSSASMKSASRQLNEIRKLLVKEPTPVAISINSTSSGPTNTA